MFLLSVEVEIRDDCVRCAKGVMRTQNMSLKPEIVERVCILHELSEESMVVSLRTCLMRIVE